MHPDQHNPNGYQPQQPVVPQQTLDGQYTVVPPINNNPGASGHNPYEFIMQPNSKKTKLSLGGASMFRKIALVASGAILLIIVGAVAFSALGPKSSTPALLAVAQQQQEIMRIATDASRKVDSQDVSNLVVNTNLTLITNQTKLLSYLATKANTKPNVKTLALGHDAKTDELLKAAASAGSYDRVVAQTLQEQLISYQSLAQTAYEQTKSASAKALLQQDFNDAKALLEQAESVISAST
jgi:hypothetical protein